MSLICNAGHYFVMLMHIQNLAQLWTIPFLVVNHIEWESGNTLISKQIRMELLEALSIIYTSVNSDDE